MVCKTLLSAPVCCSCSASCLPLSPWSKGETTVSRDGTDERITTTMNSLRRRVSVAPEKSSFYCAFWDTRGRLVTEIKQTRIARVTKKLVVYHIV